MTKHEVIGQGTYGCVLKPSLECKQKTTIDYNKKVSKILHSTDAKKEMLEYSKVSKADKKNDFYLGKPHKCNLADIDALSTSAVEECKIGAEVLDDIENYNLIVMDDGGDNLANYTDNMRNWSRSEMSTENCEKFLLEIPRLLKGLKLFLDNDLIHFDLKPQNIVYNEKTGRLNFIDFGMMKNRSAVKADAEKNACHSAFFHWSYPWELQFINKKKFVDITKNDRLQEEEIAKVKDRKGSRLQNLKHFFYFTADKSDFNHAVEYYIDGYEAFIIRSGSIISMPSMKYEDFLNKALDTIDIFGVGMALNYWFQVAKKHLDDDLSVRLERMFYLTINPVLVTRYNIDAFIADYHSVLHEFNLLDQYNMEIVNGIAVEKKLPSPLKSRRQRIRIPKLKNPDDAFANADPSPCPPGKERNPKTGRCIKTKVPKDNTEPCPPGKERNPKTGRCIKTKVLKDNTETCPAGKERNPKTKRCINVCKDGYERDASFKCTRKKR